MWSSLFYRVTEKRKEYEMRSDNDVMGEYYRNLRVLPAEVVRMNDEGYLQASGWRCAICFKYAGVLMIDVTLCEEHAKRYKFGYGESLKSMFEEVNK
jgi:hypothetical protein